MAVTMMPFQWKKTSLARKAATNRALLAEWRLELIDRLIKEHRFTYEQASVVADTLQKFVDGEITEAQVRNSLEGPLNGRSAKLAEFIIMTEGR